MPDWRYSVGRVRSNAASLLPGQFALGMDGEAKGLSVVIRKRQLKRSTTPFDLHYGEFCSPGFGVWGAMESG